MNKNVHSAVAKPAAAALAAILLLSGTGVAHAQTTTSIEAQIQALMAQINALKGTASATTFTRDLTIGSTGADVTALQNWLISKGYSLPAGATGYFGAQTRAALAAYQSANGIAPAAGYFGPATRAKVNASGTVTTPTTPTTPSTSGELKGGEADLSKYDLRRENSSGSEGESDVEAASVSFDVEDGDIRIERMEITAKAQNTGLNQQPWKYFDAVTVRADGKEIASQDVDSRNDWSKQNDGSYKLTLTGLKQIVRENKSADLSISFDINDSIDSSDLAQTFALSIADRGIRAVDSAGIQQYIGNASDTVLFGFDAEENGDVAIKSNKKNPDTAILVADDERESESYDVFVFDLENKDDVDTLLTDLSISVGNLNGGVSADDVIRRATLDIDGDEFDGDITADSIDFEDMDLEIGGDDTVTATLSVRLVRNATSTPISFSVSANGIEAEGVDSGDDAQVSGSQASDVHTIALTGIAVEPVSVKQFVTTPGDDASNSYGTYTLKFEVTALEDDAYVASTTAASGTVGALFSIGGNAYTGTTSAVMTSTARSENGYYLVREGTTETFTVTVVLDPSVAGTFDVRLNSVRFNDEASLAGSTEYSVSNSTDYRTDALYIAN